jgi:hypothetical protein
VGSLFNNSGTVDVQNGTLVLNEVAPVQTGAFSASAGAVITFNDGFTFGSTSSLSGAGQVSFNNNQRYYFDNTAATNQHTIATTVVNDAAITFLANENIDALTLQNNGGLAHDTVTVDVNDTLTVLGGHVRGTGRTDANAAHVINGLFDIRQNHQFRSFGAGVVNANKEVSIYSGGRWDVASGGSVDFQGNNTISSPDDAGYMLNSGTITKTADGVTHVYVHFENDGLVHVQDQARWSLHHDANHGGAFDLDADSALRLHDSTHTFLPSSAITGDGEFLITQGSTAVIEGDLDVGLILIDGDSTLDMQVDGTVKTLEFTNGSITGPGDLDITVGLSVTGNGALAKSISTSSLNVSNTGSLTIDVAGAVHAPVAVGVLTNDGTVTKSGGGNSTIELKTNNNGVMTINSGSGLLLPKGFEQSGGGTLIVDGDIVFGSYANVNGGMLKGKGKAKAEPDPGPVPPFSINVGLGESLATLAPGDSPGALTLEGDLQLGHMAVLEVELAGLTQGVNYDLLSITGTADLGGALKVLLLDGFSPQLGAAFDVLDWSAVTGTFDSISLPPLASGLAWNTSQLYTDGSLSVVASPPGDFDSNGRVDGNDLLVWQRGGSPTPNSPADLAAWKSNYGFGATAITSTSAPEPHGAALVLIGAGVLLSQRRMRLRRKNATTA